MSQDFIAISDPSLGDSYIQASTKDELLRILSAAMRQDYVFLSNEIITITDENINAICNKIINITQELPCIIRFKGSTCKHPYFTVCNSDYFNKYEIESTSKYFHSFDNFLTFNSSTKTVLNENLFTIDNPNHQFVYDINTGDTSANYTFTDYDKNIIYKFFKKYVALMNICTPETLSVECKYCKFSSDNTHAKQGYCSTLCVEDWNDSDIEDFINTVISSDNIFIKSKTDIYKEELQGILDSNTKKSILSSHEIDTIEQVIKLLNQHEINNNLCKESV